MCFLAFWVNAKWFRVKVRSIKSFRVVDLDPSWSQEKVQDWANRHQVEVLARLPIGTNMVVIKTAPGLAALELANKLYRSGEVRDAFPDWWTEKTIK